TQSNLLDAIVKALGISFGNESRQSPAAPPPKVTGRRILLAEDNPVNQLLMVRLLEKQGHSVTVVANGEDALTALAHDSFHLLIMDLQRPVMGGLEATAIIREQEKNTGKRLPIIAMTAHAMKGDRERCLAAGMDDYIAKPIQPEQLWRILNQFLPATGRNG